MPVIAFFNAGVAVTGVGMSVEGEPGALISAGSIGVALALLIGKPIGILGFVWLVVVTGMSRLPACTNWMTLLGVGLLAGIGFTISLFVANLAVPATEQLDQAKIGVLAGSTLAAIAGYVFLRAALPKAAAGAAPA
jgi:Na+:H+ antiporter, NhaA family